MEDLRRLPGIDRLYEIAATKEEFRAISRAALMQILRVTVEGARASLKVDKGVDVSVEAILNSALKELANIAEPNLRRVINATGVAIHTNLGRAPLSKRAVEAVTGIMQGYSTLEYDLSRGERGSRHDHIVERLCALTGAEDALGVNNNAAAVLLALSSLAKGKEVIVSRGQLVEIGGSFRIPEVLAQSGARLVEVGTTNKTHLRDYEQAITADTAMILKVHTSNYRIIGFTAQPSDEELTALARRYNLICMDDLGSGTLLPIHIGDWREPSVIERLEAGYDLVSFSGDKLLGAGQAGIVAGKKDLIGVMKKHPLARALRMDKLSLAALEGTLQDYMLGDPYEVIPVQRMLHEKNDTLQAKARELATKLESLTKLGWQITVLPLNARAGGGSLPGAELAGWGVAFNNPQKSANEMERRLRDNIVPIIALIRDDQVMLDVRTLSETDMDEISAALYKIAGEATT